MMVSRPPKESIFTCALMVIVTHLFLSIMIQLENYLFYIFQFEDGVQTLFSFLLLLPFCQLQHLSFAFILGFFCLPFLPFNPLRWVYLLIVSCVNLYLVVNQIFFPIFFDHFQLSFSEGHVASFASLWDSIVAEMGLPFYINLTVWLVIELLLIQQITKFNFVPMAKNWSVTKIRQSTALKLVLLIVLISNLVIGFNRKNYNLEKHAVFTLINSCFSSTQEVQLKPSAYTANIYERHFDTDSEIADKNQLVFAAAEKIRSRSRPPNIIMIVLESVGSVQLFDDGTIKEEFAPNLASMSDHMIIFDSIYSTFPGTIRSHVPTITGGHTITWGSVYEELSFKYNGPTIISELKKHGYKTALFSAQNFETENMDEFYENIEYNYLFEPNLGSDAFREDNEIHSWGVREDAITKLMVDWIDKRVNEPSPFFIQFLTVSTHHPYGIPDRYKKLLDGKDRYSRYYSSLHYNDHVINSFITDLKRRNVLDNTIILITGDHGQAFGKRHRKNFTHKNYIYEENIKSFLIVLDFKSINENILSRATGTMGDLMPSILSLVNLPIPNDLLGENLFSPHRSERIAYFHKNANPELLGLKDGKWKFIVNKIGEPNPELYNLTDDPAEQNNLADSHQNQVSVYRDLCVQWYIQTNEKYTSRLRNFNFTGGRGLTLDDITEPGPKVLTFGYRKNGKFHEQKEVHPYEQIIAWTRVVEYPEDKEIQYQWISPTGVHYNSNFTIRSDWSKCWSKYRGPLPLDEGKWTLRLYDSGNFLIGGNFMVSSQAKLSERLESKLPVNLSTMIGHLKILNEEGDHDILEPVSLSKNEPVYIQSFWEPRKSVLNIEYEWISPSGDIFREIDRLKGTTLFKKSSISLPLEVGRWHVNIKTKDGIKLAESDFVVSDNSVPISSYLPARYKKRLTWPELDGDKEELTISFVHFNDLHANYHPRKFNDNESFSPLSLIRGFYDQVKAENPYTIFCSGGDEMEKGSLIDLVSKGESTIEIYKHVGLHFRAVGNHDFAYSEDQIKRFLDVPGDVPLCANQSLGESFIRFDIGTIRCGVFGMVGKPWNEQDKQFTGKYYNSISARYDYVNQARKIVARHRDSVDILFMISHLGYKSDKKIGSRVSGIDLIIGGHSHTVLETESISNHGTIIVQAGAWGDYVGRLDISINMNTRKIMSHNYELFDVNPQNMKPSLHLENKIRSILKKYDHPDYYNIGNLSKPLDKHEIAKISVDATVNILNTDAVLIDVESIWETPTIGTQDAQNFLDCYKVEIEPPGTHGFNSMCTAEISGADLAIIKNAKDPRFYVKFPPSIIPGKTYKIALQRRTAFGINDFFSDVSELSSIRFEMETWQILSNYATSCNDEGLPLNNCAE